MSPCDIRGGFDIGEVCTATSGGFHFDAKGILIVCCFSFVTAGAKEKLTKENAVGCFASAEATNAPRVGAAPPFEKGGRKRQPWLVLTHR